MKLCISLISLFGTLIAFGAGDPVRQLNDENRLDEALAICRQYEVLLTRDPDHYLSCAWVYYRTGRADAGDKALYGFAKSSKVPEFLLLQIYGGIVRSQLALRDAENLPDNVKIKTQNQFTLKLDEAQKRLEGFIVEHRSTNMGRQAQALSAEVYEWKGQLDPAAFIYRGLITDDPKMGKAHWGLGRYYLARNDTRRAIFHLEETAKLWPAHLASRYNLGMIYVAQGLDGFRDAAKWLGEAYKLNKADPGVLEQIGVLFELKDRVPDALRYWQRALELRPDTQLAKQKLDQYFGQSIDGLLAQGKFADVIAKIDSAPKALTTEPKFNLRKGVAQRNLGRYQEAIVSLKPYVESNPEDVLGQREIGIAYVNLKQGPQAEVHFQKAITLEPNNGMNYAWMGFAMESRKDLPKALEFWTKASQMIKEPDDLKRAIEKVVRLETRVGKQKRAVAGEKKSLLSPDGKNQSGPAPSQEKRNPVDELIEATKPVEDSEE